LECGRDSAAFEHGMRARRHFVFEGMRSVQKTTVIPVWLPTNTQRWQCTFTAHTATAKEKAMVGKRGCKMLSQLLWRLPDSWHRLFIPKFHEEHESDTVIQSAMFEITNAPVGNPPNQGKALPLTNGPVHN
jgi:hypothetical protein